MTRLKTILRSKKFYIISCIILIIYIIISTCLIKYKSHYENVNYIEGNVIKVTEKENKISLIINNKEKIQINYYYKNEKPLISMGDKVGAYGTKSEMTNMTIPNTFNYKEYLYNKRIYLVINADNIVVIKKNNSLLNKIKTFLINRVEGNSYMNLLILGDKSLLDSEIYQSYQTNGVAHLLAISGLHLSILVLVLNKLLFFMKDNKRFILITSLLLSYAYLINFPSSFLRVVVFFIISFLNKKYLLNLSNIKMIYLTGTILLIINPFFIYDIGFHFSFVTVFGIMLSSKYLKFNYIINLILITIISFLFTLPIVVNLNYEINLITFLINLLLVPLVSFVIYPLALINLIIPIINPIFIILTSIMENISLFFSQIEFTKIIIPKIPIYITIVYYFSLITIIYYNKLKLIIIPLLLIIIHKYSYYLNKDYLISFFDVGQGDSSIIISPYLKDIVMIDTGGLVNSNYHVSKNIVLYLKSIGVNKISTLVITHGDFDHMGEAINIIQNFKVEKVIFNCGEFNDLEKELIKVSNNKKIKYYSCIKELNIYNNKLYFLQTKEYVNENDNSNVIYTELSGYKFIFMGDASITTEKEILSKYNLSDIDVLKVGHHGSKTSSGKEFIDETNPKYSIISVGKNNRYGHPNKEALDNLNNSKIYRTDEDGSIMFKIKSNKLKIETCSP